jgi:hypothetical protein
MQLDRQHILLNRRIFPCCEIPAFQESRFFRKLNESITAIADAEAMETTGSECGINAGATVASEAERVALSWTSLGGSSLESALVDAEAHDL